MIVNDTFLNLLILFSLKGSDSDAKVIHRTFSFWNYNLVKHFIFQDIRTPKHNNQEMRFYFVPGVVVLMNELPGIANFILSFKIPIFFN